MYFNEAHNKQKEEEELNQHPIISKFCSVTADVDEDYYIFILMY